MSTAATSQTKYAGPVWRGVDYSPTWPTWVVGAGATQTGDSDFANDAFQSLWAGAYMAAPSGDTSAPTDNGTNYRNDLQTIADAGFNLVRLYNWDMARGTTSTSNVGLDHINFLNTAASLGLKVVVPVSDWFLSDDASAWNFTPATIPANYDFTNAPVAIQTDFNQFVASITDPATGKIHAAVHSIDVGNEGDIGQGLNGQTTPSYFLYRTIWWIVNLHQQINGSSPGPDGSAVVNGPTPVVPLTATFSNGDQGLNIGSWFNCLIAGVAADQATPTNMDGNTSFAAAVTGLKAADPTFAQYYYNSTNISQVSTVTPFGNSLAATMALYDSGASPWPGADCTVPLLLMELFTPNRTVFPAPTDQAVAAVGQVTDLETYLAQHRAGTSNSSTYLMGYNYFEFNDEQQVKLTGLYQYGTSFVQAATGTTSVFYSPYQFSNMDFPVYSPLSATPGPTGSGTLVDALTQCMPGPHGVQGSIVAVFGEQGHWQATFYTGSPIPSWVTTGMSVRGVNIPAGTTVNLPTPSPAPVDMTVVLVCSGSQTSNPFKKTDKTVTLSFH